MTLTLAHTVEIGEIDNKTDFTSRVLGFTVQQMARPQRVNPNRAIITLDNNDGALTPNAGGTYDGVDWFSQGVFIETTVNGGSSQVLFHGIVDDFALADTGTNSTVQIVALDWVAIFGRLAPKDYSGLLQQGPGTAIGYTISLKLSGPDDMVKLGGTGALRGVGLYGNDNVDVPLQITATSDQFITDVLQNDVMAPDLCVAYGGKIGHISATDTTVYYPVIIGNTLTRSLTSEQADTLNTFTFTGATPTAGQLPISEAITGYNIEELVNTVYSTRDGGTTQTVQDTTSADKYGARSYSTSQHAATTDTATLNGATNIVNRLSTSRFTAQQIRFDTALLANTPADRATQLELLLDVDTALWQPCEIKYTPTGAAIHIASRRSVSGC